MSTLRELISDITDNNIPARKVVKWLRKRGIDGQITIIRYADGWAIEAPGLEARFPAIAAKLTQPFAWKRLKMTDLPAIALDTQLAPDEEAGE